MMWNKYVLKTVQELLDTQRQNLQKRESKLNAFVITMSRNFMLIRQIEGNTIFLTTTPPPTTTLAQNLVIQKIELKVCQLK